MCFYFSFELPESVERFEFCFVGHFLAVASFFTVDVSGAIL